MQVPEPTLALARRLRALREEEWPDVKVTQSDLADALSGSSSVRPATVSSWESLTAPKVPPTSRLIAYALFFATRRSMEERPHLLDPPELHPEGEARRAKLERELLSLHDAVRRPRGGGRRRSWHFDEGPVTIICPDAPEDLRGPLADPGNPNYVGLLTFADLDALIELHGHIRAENPDLQVNFVVATQVVADHLSGHVVLLGGVAWNPFVRDFLSAAKQVPIKQIEDEKVETGEIFVVSDGGGSRKFYPTWGGESGDVLSQDVALLCRLPNPYNVSRTLTICNGIHSRGVMGAVRSLTDRAVRARNEDYLAERFPGGDAFALLLRVPVVAGLALSPDLQNPENRLFEWSGEMGNAS